MTLFSERIKEIRTDLGMNKAQFAEHIYTSPSNITRYEQKDMNVSMAAIEEISKNLHISPSWLMGWSNDKYGLDYIHYVKVPIINQIKSGAPFMFPDNFEGFEIVSNNRNADFCTIVSDGDMYKAGINVNDMVFFKKQSTAENGDLVAIVNDGGCIYVRRYYKYGNKISLRTEGHTIAEEVVENVTIAGKVLFIIAEVF